MSQMYALFDGPDKSEGAFPIVTSQAYDLNKKGYGIFFSVNSFKTVKRVEGNLKKLNSWFVDIDGGSKDKQFKKFLEFPLLPTAIVETKNGHHAYWGCSGKPNVEEYKNILERLVNWFNSDRNAQGITRIMRLPNYMHVKNPKSPFKIRQIFDSDSSYTYSDMNKTLPEVEIKVLKPSNSPISFEMPSNDSFWKNVLEYDCVSGLERLSGAQELNGDTISFKHSSGGKKVIVVNGKAVSGCWIDQNNMIGSFSSGGPSIGNWIKWYGHDWNTIAQIIKKYIPEFQSDHSCLAGFLSNL